MDWVHNFFADKYHDLKLTQKLSAGQTVYHSIHTMIPTIYRSSALDNLALATTTENIHRDQLMAEIHHMTDTNNILGDQIKYLADTNTILESKFQDKKVP